MNAAWAPWWERAVCRTLPPEEADAMFFPDNGGKTGHHPAKLDAPAIAMCGTCPVRRECLSDALAEGYQHQFGTRGGLTDAQRRKLLRRGAHHRGVA